MSFLKRLGSRRSKTTESADGEDDAAGKGKSQKSKRGASFNVTVRPREEDVANSEGLDEDKEKEKERRKYKDMSGLLVGQQESVSYPNFVVHYLGRIPTSSEYGKDAVEEPVNQLCKLREKQKLQRVFLTFNVEGLFCREISGPFFKQKKDGFNMHIPLHHITYGVGCTAHPTVFACVAKMNDDPNPANQVLVLHAFVCDKPETTQAVTYWQLQAYIEAYEDLKRKRILRARRKQAIEGSSSTSQSQKRTENSATVSDEGGPKSEAKPSKHSVKRHTQSNTDSPNREESQENSARSSNLSGKRSSTKRTDSPTTTEQQREGLDSSTKSSKSSIKRPTNNNNVQPKTIVFENPVQDSKHQLPRLQLHSGKPREEVRQEQPISADVYSNYSQADHHHDVYAMDSPQNTGFGQHARKPSSASTGSGASCTSSSESSGHGGGEGSPLTSPAAKGKANKTFEKRIGELNTLVNMDAEKLKMLMINEHPTLARRIYYRATVDESGVFHQSEEAEDSNA